jgi:plastocyanin
MRSIGCAFVLLLALPCLGADEFLPVVARGEGANSTFFRSDVRIVNPSSSAVTARLSLLSSGLDNSAAPAVDVTIGAREARDLDDIVQSVFGLTAGSGAVRISSDVDLVISSRTYTPSQDPGCPGTFGQYIPSLAMADAMSRGIIAHVGTAALPGSGFRTNLGVTNPNAESATVRLTLRNGAGGGSLGSATVEIPPFSHTQRSLSSLYSIDSVTSTNLFVEIDSSIPVFAYASVVDNQSGDQIFVLAERDGGTPNEGLLIIAKQWEFQPSTIEVTAGQLVTVRVRAIDVDHGISFSGVGPFTCTSEQAGQCVLRPNETVTVTFTPHETGSFAFFCTRFCGGSEDGLHGHDTMRGTLVVK